MYSVCVLKLYRNVLYILCQEFYNTNMQDAGNNTWLNPFSETKKEKEHSSLICVCSLQPLGQELTLTDVGVPCDPEPQH